MHITGHKVQEHTPYNYFLEAGTFRTFWEGSQKLTSTKILAMTRSNGKS